MELFKLFGTILIDNEKANQSIHKTDQQAESSGNKISSSFKKIGAAVGAFLSVKLITDFGKACVETAASVKASNSQFEQTFGNLAEDADIAMKRVADSSGIMQSRLQDSGTKIYAFAKTTGMESTEALGLMEDALQVSADSAAYYDRSLEQTTETLQSFLKGNYENDAALGLSATETTRNTAANKLYGKSFQQLSESQKQMTLLQMVKDANKLSGAMGQAARESDGYENVMGNLKEAWRQFLAVIGDPILSAVIPIIQGLTTIVDGLGFKVSLLRGYWSTFATGINSDWFSFAQPIFDALSETVNVLYTSWQIIWPSLQNLFMTFWSLCQAAWESIGKPVFETIMFVAEQCINFFNENWPKIAQVIADVIDTISKFWNEVLKPVFEAIGVFIDTILRPVFEVVFTSILSAVQNAFDGIVGVWNDVLKPILNGIIDFVGGIFSGDWSQAWDGITSILSGIWEGLKNVLWTPIQWFLDKVGGVIDFITKPFSDAAAAIGGVWENIKSVFKLPHFTMDGSWNPLDWLDDGFPSIGVEWYAKGGIMERASAFGFNPFSGKMMVGGEKEDEAIAPLSKLEEYFRKWSASEEMAELLKQIRDYLSDDERWYRIMLRALSDGSFAVVLDDREIGRIVRKT